jgi:drug/metabolite transporter (DMT)-like permease
VSLNPFAWSRRVKLIVAFATLYVVWGSTYLGIRVGLEADLPPTLFAGWRLVPAGLLLLALARVRGTSLRIRLDEYRIVAIVGLFLLVGGMYFTFLAERTIPSGLAALIVALLPLWVALAESFVPGMERPTARGYLGLVIGFAGLGVLVAPRLTGISGTPEEFVGIGLQILGTWLWTTGSIVSKRNPVTVDPLVATGYEMLTAGAVLLGLGTLLGEWPRFNLTPAGFGALAYLSVIGSCVAFTAFVWLLAHAPASKVMTYAYVNPVIAVFLGWAAGSLGLVPPEPVDGWVIVGMAIIISGVALTTSAPTRPSASVAAPEPEAGLAVVTGDTE